tara:strand:- start:170 stop:433 length:264 start_codon:yes stop_codon:yes gene_type:complete
MYHHTGVTTKITTSISDPEVQKELQRIKNMEYKPPPKYLDPKLRPLWDICLFRSYQPESYGAQFLRDKDFMKKMRKEHPEKFAKYNQ